jgi:hypothetical protein
MLLLVLLLLLLLLLLMMMISLLPLKFRALLVSLKLGLPGGIGSLCRLLCSPAQDGELNSETRARLSGDWLAGLLSLLLLLLLLLLLTVVVVVVLVVVVVRFEAVASAAALQGSIPAFVKTCTNSTPSAPRAFSQTRATSTALSHLDASVSHFRNGTKCSKHV